MSELPTLTTDGRMEAGTLAAGYDTDERKAVAADRNRSGASEAMAKE